MPLQECIVVSACGFLLAARIEYQRPQRRAAPGSHRRTQHQAVRRDARWADDLLLRSPINCVSPFYHEKMKVGQSNAATTRALRTTHSPSSVTGSGWNLSVR
jgi:hypothetical protein